MKMTRQPLDWKHRCHMFKHLLHLESGTDTNGVGDINLIATEIAHSTHHIGNRFRLYLALIRTPQRTADTTAQP